MVPSEVPYPDVNTDIFIFFLRPLCKIIWINVHYFPNAPRNCQLACVKFLSADNDLNNNHNDNDNENNNDAGAVTIVLKNFMFS